MLQGMSGTVPGRSYGFRGNRLRRHRHCRPVRTSKLPPIGGTKQSTAVGGWFHLPCNEQLLCREAEGLRREGAGCDTGYRHDTSSIRTYEDRAWLRRKSVSPCTIPAVYCARIRIQVPGMYICDSYRPLHLFSPFLFCQVSTFTLQLNSWA